MLSRSLKVLLLLLISRSASSQNGVFLKNAGDATFRLSHLPGLGNSNFKAVEYPVSSGNYALNRLDFWITGIDQTGDTVALCSDIFSNKSAWVSGPTSISGNRMHVDSAEWKSFISVNASEINYHKSHYLDGNYVVPSGIAFWPAAYNVSGFPKVLAAFADANQNGVYEYKSGDYPYVPGAENVFTMGSDSTLLLRNSGISSHLDMATLWFLSEKSDSSPNTIFFRNVICNRGTETINGLKVSAVAAMQIGMPNDNFLSTDVENGSIVGINAAGNDGIYGNTWPAVAVGWLSEKPLKSIYFDPGSDAVNGKPVHASDFYNLSNGYWKTGKFLSFGGSGLDGSVPASFVYSNGTDIGQSNKDWDETPGTAGVRTGLISTGWNELKGNTCKAVDGFVKIIPNAPDSASLRTSLKSTRNFYEKSEFNVGIKYNPKPMPGFNLYPNPVGKGQVLFLDGLTKGAKLEIFGFSGLRIAYEKPTGNSIILNLPAGIYIVKADGYLPQILCISGN
ncbi:MAG: T9SS type A sorting domain-containing protein [Bacteroidetes bacterium]|nr:T9SS type A sorting domain-containing protein [Bacteroidota bacterium]